MGGLPRTSGLDISLTEVDQHPTLQEYEQHYRRCQSYRQEFDKPDDHFLWGRVSYRCPESSKGLGQGRQRRMDWVLALVNKNRLGENRHRYHVDLNSPKSGDDVRNDNHPRGTGHLCKETRVPEPNLSVHYFGQRNGYQGGKVNGIQLVVSCDGNQTLEWTVIPDAAEGSTVTKVAGDSGAWVIDDASNRVVGMIWGWCDYGLIFTPINEIFADIQDQLEVDTPRLPDNFPDQDPEPSPPAMATLACDVMEHTGRLARPHKFTKPTIGGRLPAARLLEDSPLSLTDSRTSQTMPQVTVLSPKDVSVEEDANSEQCPSLSASSSSTPCASPETSSSLTTLDQESDTVLISNGEYLEGSSQEGDLDDIKIYTVSDKNAMAGPDRQRGGYENKLSVAFVLSDALDPQIQLANIGTAA
jgi:hypothetical protein